MNIALIVTFMALITGILGLLIAKLANAPYWGLMVWFVLFAIFIFQGLKKIQADPPHKGVLTIWGKRQKEVLSEGLHFFPFYRLWYNFIPVKVEKINYDLKPDSIRTTDRAELAMDIGITFTPAELIPFLDSGGEEGVKKILDDIIPECVRQWAFSKEEGPQDWGEAMGAREDAIAILLKAILGEELTTIPNYAQLIPTPIWLKYFKKPRGILLKKDKEIAGDSWEKVDDLYLNGNWTQEQKDELEKAVEKRRGEINQTRKGNGKIVHPDLGIAINRLNIGQIKTKGELEKVAELQVKEEEERKGEIFEVDTDLIKAEKLVEAAKKAGQNINITQAFQIIMEWKTAREVKGAYSFTIPGLSPAITEIAKKFLK